MTEQDNFKLFADNLYTVFEDFKLRSNDPNISLEQQMIWAISANLAIQIANCANVISINHKGNKE